MTTRPPRTFKLQRVDRLADLRADDPVIHRDAYLFDRIKNAYRKNARPLAKRAQLKTRTSLYCRLRGNGFPLKQPNGKTAPIWRTLSPWMKVQMATLSLAEQGYMQFSVHLHDEIRMDLEGKGACLKDYLRDRLTRLSSEWFGESRHFFFVMEDMDPDGEPVRPHAHGSIAVRPEALPKKGEKRHLHYKRMAERHGQDHAERIYGLERTKEMLRAASGNVQNKCSKVIAGNDQSRNVWVKTPSRPFTNEGWVTYAFKNAQEFSTVLGDRRLALSQALRTEARKLWELVRLGEDAIRQWE